MATSCPEYEPLAMCSIDWEEDEVNDPKKALETLIGLQTKRVKMHAKNEELEGGTPDQILSGEMDRLTRMLQIRTDLDTSKFKLTVESSQRSAGSGLLASLFGGGASENKELPEAAPVIKIPTADEVTFTEEIVVEKKTKRKKE
jgi:hypothetical protein